MNLSKRALFVIVPVLLLSYAVAAISVYYTLEASLKRLEQSRLDLSAAELAERFSKYSTFAESYLVALRENSAFRGLIKKDQDEYLYVALGSSIEKTISDFKHHRSNKLSFTIIDPENPSEELYYFELSDDPFALISVEQQQSYRRMLEAGELSSWDYAVHEKGGSSVIVNQLIDRTTYRAPVINNLENSVLIQFTIEPTDFLELEQTFNQQHEINTVIHSIDEKVLDGHDGLISVVPISGGLELDVSRTDDYLGRILLLTKFILAIIAFVFFILSVFLLVFLVRKYITDPIHRLQVEMSDVLEHGKENIQLRHHGNDEIGRLEKAFHKMYGDLSNSYIKTKELAEHDPLTKLHNLAYVSEQAHRALRKAKDEGSHVALIYIDLDNFKFVNDKHGHEVGDELLKAFASRLTRVIREGDLIFYDESKTDAIYGRIAGDEFCVIVSNYVSEDVPAKVAKRILSLFENGFSFERGNFPVSASIGVAVYPEDGKLLTELVSNADNAMYQAKNSGKNNVAFYSADLAKSTRRRMDIEHELKSIDPDSEFYLVYMPLVCSRTNKIDGFEVLVRWVSPRLGFVGPDEFVPIAESCGLFNKIDSWVVEAALKSYDALKQRLGSDFKLSINLSSAQLNMNLIGDRLITLVEQYQINPSFIQFEMTETQNVEFTTRAAELLDELCEAGFRIAIDDFGTGYTALLQLIEYPAQMIKFDKTFVDKAMHPDNRSMIEPLIKLCHSQGLQVTVEGVETKEMAEYLVSIGADYLQGYYFGVPAKLESLNLILNPSGD